MALKMRLARHGAKKRPHYAIVVADSRAPRDGRFIEKVGRYNPMVSHDHPERIVIAEDRVKYWLGQGVEPTDRVERFLSAKGLIKGYQQTAQTKKSTPKAKAQERLKAEVEAREKAAADAKAAKEAAAAAAAQPAAPEVTEVQEEQPVAEAEAAPEASPETAAPEGENA